MTDHTSSSSTPQSSTVLKQSMWTGAVCALAIVITALNCFPPIDVQYKVVSQVLVAQPRLDRLKAELELERKITTPPKDRFVQLTRVKTVDGAKADDLILVEVESIWNARTTQHHVERWLDRISKPDPRQVVHTEAAREDRFAKWQAEATKHYLEQHRYLSSDTVADHTKLASSPRSKKTVTKLASTNVTKKQKTPAKTVATPKSKEPQSGFELELTQSVQKAEDEVKNAEKAFASTFTKYAGAIELVGRPQIRSKTSRIPGWMSASILILALSTGSIASLLQYRAQSAGAYDPHYVGNRLAADGLPVVGQFEVSPSKAADLPTPNTYAKLVRWLSNSQLMRMGEWLLLIWCVMIAGRLLTDPLWRSVAIESPLAAFGRLVAGMP